MIDTHARLIGFRLCATAMCLALLAACIPDPPAVSIASVPTNLAAVPGNAAVTLTWTASTDATSYGVKRAAISGGPYTQIASPTATSYTDMALTNGTTYYYVVSALNSSGESANSAQISAIPTSSSPPPATFGTWTDVTPAGVTVTTQLGCGNFGSQTVQSDPAHPSDLYTQFNCQGIWKSTDFGATWAGPINTGTNGATVTDCAGGITIWRGSTASVPTIYQACIRGSGTGFWKSVDGGVNWSRHVVAATTRQDYYPPVVDPYDGNHLLMSAHEFDSVVESFDGGQNWASVPIASGMLLNGLTGAIHFINTGNAPSTRGTWLWMGEQTGGNVGTWRTANSGGSWTKVESHEHPLGASQIYQPGSDGVVFIAGVYSALGWGVLRSTDYGQTWTHVGGSNRQIAVFGTPKNVYSMDGGPVGIGGTLNPAFQVASQPGTGTWATPGTPAGLTQGAAQISVVNNGTSNILVGAMWNNGVWRYVEP